MLNSNQSTDPFLFFLAFSTGGINSIAAYTSAIAEYSGAYGTNNKLPGIINYGNDLAVIDGAEWRSPYHPVVQVCTLKIFFYNLSVY